jgi:hypothetical protein
MGRLDEGLTSNRARVLDGIYFIPYTTFVSFTEDFATVMGIPAKPQVKLFRGTEQKPNFRSPQN